MVTLLSAGWLELPIVSYFSLHELNPLSCVLFPLGRYCESRIGISWNNSPAQVCWRTQRGLLLSGSYVLQLFSLFDRQPRLNIIRFLVGHVVYGGPNRVAYSNELEQKFQVKGDIFFAKLFTCLFDASSYWNPTREMSRTTDSFLSSMFFTLFYYRLQNTEEIE